MFTPRSSINTTEIRHNNITWHARILKAQYTNNQSQDQVNYNNTTINNNKNRNQEHLQTIFQNIITTLRSCSAVKTRLKYRLPDQ